MAIKLYMPKINSNDDSVKIISCLISDRCYVKAGDEILLVETSKTNVSIDSEQEGYLLYQIKEGQNVRVGDCYASLYSNLEELEKAQLELKDESTQKQSRFSNSALKYIEENNLCKRNFENLGLVTVEKIKKTLVEQKMNNLLMDQSKFPNSYSENISQSKLAEIKALHLGKKQAIASSLTIQFNSLEIRENLSKYSWLNRNIFAYILHVFVRMLPKYPKFTSFYSDEKIHFYNKINLGIAIDLGKGLKVVVLSDSDKKSLFDLQMSLIDCIANYYEDSLTVASLSDSTITVSDLSNDNILYFQPVLNARQSVILGIGGDSSIANYPMTLTIVFDHCVLSGQEVASFLTEFKNNILKDYLRFEINPTFVMREE